MVEAKIEDVTETKKKINIRVPQEMVSKYLQKAYQKVGGKAKIKGFRPGKIPQTMLDRHYGPEIDMECLQFLVDETYAQALYNNQVIPINSTANRFYNAIASSTKPLPNHSKDQSMPLPSKLTLRCNGRRKIKTNSANKAPRESNFNLLRENS